MKKLALVFALFVGMVQAETETPKAPLLVGQEAHTLLANWANDYNKITQENSAFAAFFLHRLCSIQHFPLASAIGAAYSGATIYATLKQIEETPNHPFKLMFSQAYPNVTLSENEKKAIKRTLCTLAAISGALTFAYYRKQLLSIDSVAYLATLAKAN